MPTDNNHPLDKVFHPASIAIVGASSNPSETGWVKRLLDFGYKGKIYPINPKASEIQGLKAYSTVFDVPNPIEYAILNIPAYLVPQAMRDCIAKSIKFVHCFAAGFNESGTEEGKQLQAKITKIAGDGGVRLIGPNCMGIYCPVSGITFCEDFPKQTGRIALVSQSGAEASRLIFLCQDFNLYFSKVVNYGNAADLDAPELLEYLAQDEETDIITLYIEGVKDYRRFVTAVKQCLKKKPVIILKAGLTKNGAEVAAFHTASVPSSQANWDTFLQQTGAIPAQTMDEVADILQGISRIKKLNGKRVAIIGRGGGIGVVATDICERAGLIVPQLSPETHEKLLQIRSDAGAMLRNPVEPKLGMEGAADFYLKGLPIIDRDTETDIILIQMAVDIYGGHTPDMLQDVSAAAYALCAVVESIHKPIAVVLFAGGHLDTITAVSVARDILTKAGIPVFSGVEAAVRSLNKIYDYYRSIENIK
jgi:acyl-CoA synthetase (NDP forming)